MWGRRTAYVGLFVTVARKVGEFCAGFSLIPTLKH
jgi:hypothetical protein